MFRITLTSIATLLITLCFGQIPIMVTLEGQVFNASGDLTLQRNDGQKELVLATIKLDEKGNFKQEVKLEAADYYSLGAADQQRTNLIIEKTGILKVYGDGRNLFYQSNIIGSEASTYFNEFLRINSVYQIRLDSANNYLRNNPQEQKQVQQSFAPIHQEYVNYRTLFMREAKNSPALLAVIPSLNMEKDFAMYEDVVKNLKNSFGASPTVQRMVAEYEKNKKLIEAKMPVPIGSDAKEIALPNPEGDTLRLSDYKGKVVLLDFWASWCGPCRRENPNVVKAYQKYHDKGFEIFSVSLDRDKAKWVQAIQQDNLAWPGHVSDLKFWSSDAAKLYKVNSIPSAFLIDQDGKIVATNLRGQALENKLSSLLD